MTLLEEAIVFAVEAHSGMVRKDGSTPYILHPLEAAAIAGTLTADQEILAAVVLHDTVEDTEVTNDELRERFGDRVADLVAAETEDKRPELTPTETWKIRKEESIRELSETKDSAVRILWLSDKLSNMRSFYRIYRKSGVSMWNHFHNSDPAAQAWYYRSVLAYTEEFSDSEAWQEMKRLIETVFESVV